MFDITVITLLLIFIVGIVIYFEYKKANAPQKNTYKRYKTNETRKSVFSESLKDKKRQNTHTSTQKNNELPQPSKETLKDSLSKVKSEDKKIETSTSPITPVKEIKKEEIKTVSDALPKANYAKFDHSRLLEMGLSPTEVQELIDELIAQIETEIPLIEKTIEPLDISTMSEHIHYIKGSATNLGSGGISDLLIEFYNYIQKEKDIKIIQIYFLHLKKYYSELKKQY